MPVYQVREWDRNSFPALYRSADDVSQKAQLLYLAWIGLNLALLVVGALVAAIEEWPMSPATSRIVAAAVFLIALGISLLLAYQRWERKWFAGRAIAESIKSMAWKFSTGAEPFPKSLSDEDALVRLTDQFSEILQEHRSLAADLANAGGHDEQVTSWMSSLRTTAVGVRRDVYLSQRVENQRVWYANRSSENLRSQRWWFWGFVAAQIAACIALLVEAWDPTVLVRGGGLLAALAAAILAWTQIRRYQELAQSYGLAAQELAMISARGPHVRTEDQLSRFVADAETAVSREHTGWIARRETV